MVLLGLALLAGGIYDGTIFYARWSERRAAEQARRKTEAEQARRTIDAVGGGGLKIVGFYASRAATGSGGRTTLCYGVVGAKTVRLDPPAAEVWPALSRCVPVSPRRDTEYTLTAEDGSGHSTMASLIVKTSR